MVIILFTIQGLQPLIKQQKLGEKFLQYLISGRDRPDRNKAGMKTHNKKTTLLQNSGRKERQQHYATSAAYHTADVG